MDDRETNAGAWVGGTIGVIIAVGLLIWFIRWICQGTQYKKNTRIDGKVVIITGCNTGIGKATAMDLATRGGKIYMACRDKNRTEIARQDIISKTGNTNIIFSELDLASFKSIRNFVERFLMDETQLDILILNAACLISERTLTEDGLEMQIGVSHFGHFLLTNLLLDILKSSAPSRIVAVSSIGQFWGDIQKDDINSEKNYIAIICYCQAKLANVLFSKELDRRLQGTGVTSNSLHPGAVTTDILRNYPCVNLLVLPFKIFCRTPKSGAQTIIKVAVDPDLDMVSGMFFDNCKIKYEGEKASDPELGKWLWEKSEEITGLTNTF